MSQSSLDWCKNGVCHPCFPVASRCNQCFLCWPMHSLVNPYFLFLVNFKNYIFNGSKYPKEYFNLILKQHHWLWLPSIDGRNLQVSARVLCVVSWYHGQASRAESFYATRILQTERLQALEESGQADRFPGRGQSSSSRRFAEGPCFATSHGGTYTCPVIMF